MTRIVLLIRLLAFLSRPIALLAITLLAVAWAMAPVTTHANDRPNIILMMGDDHGWEETGYNGHPHLKTPVLDEMARAGLRFDNFYAGHPTCSPTRGSFLTGRHPVRYGTFSPGFSFRPEEITIAHLLSEVGYQCGHFGKWHVGPVKSASPTSPNAMGFHESLSHDNFFEMDPSLSRNGGPPQVYPGEGSQIIIDETIRFIDRARVKKSPFLAVVWFGSPHEPYSGLDRDLSLYNDLPEEYATRKVRLTSMTTGRPTRRSLRDVLRERYAEITAMDRAIGVLRDHLADTGLRENTLLFYCGDNGSPSAGLPPESLRAEKGWMYEGGIRVPGVIEWPARIKQGRTTSVSAVTSDLAPTVCEITGAPRLDGSKSDAADSRNSEFSKRPIDGISLLPLIEGKMKQRSAPICFWQFNQKQISDTSKPYIAPKLQVGTTPLVKYLNNQRIRTFQNYHHPSVTEGDYTGSRAIIDGRYKLVVNGMKNDETLEELFDLAEDKKESNNLVDAKPDVAARLRRGLREWQDSVLNSLSGRDYQ